MSRDGRWWTGTSCGFRAQCSQGLAGKLATRKFGGALAFVSDQEAVVAMATASLASPELQPTLETAASLPPSLSFRRLRPDLFLSYERSVPQSSSCIPGKTACFSHRAAAPHIALCHSFLPWIALLSCSPSDRISNLFSDFPDSSFSFSFSSSLLLSFSHLTRHTVSCSPRSRPAQASRRACSSCGDGSQFRRYCANPAYAFTH